MSKILNPLAVLLAHDRWATERLLEVCAGLSSEQLHRRFEIGLGSLHNTILHDAAAVRSWGEVLGRGATTPWPDDSARTVKELRAMVEEGFDVFAKAAAGAPGEEFVRERDGKSYTYTRVGIVLHVHTHGVHHRAQCLNMLRQLGVSPLPPSSVVEWMRSEQAD